MAETELNSKTNRNAMSGNMAPEISYLMDGKLWTREKTLVAKRKIMFLM